MTLAVLALLASASSDTSLTTSWPGGVPNGAELGWETIDGEAENATSALAYRFYVNPARPAIYEIARYHAVKIEGGVRTAYSEKMVWNQYPSGGKGPRCYAFEGGSWRVLERGSEEYRNEMGMAMAVYGVHRRAYDR
jgi:hypothetical protein